MPSNVDWIMIEKHELTVGFGYAIPGAIGEGSGVTVGAGIDLGRHSWDEVRQWNIDAELKEKLRSYLGVTGAAARNMLYQAPKDGMFDSARSLQSQIVAPITRVVAQHGRAAHVLKAAAGGLALSESEVKKLNDAVRENKLAAIRTAYDKSAVKVNGPLFDVIPASCQTAIVSFCFHYGPNIGKKPTTDRRRAYWDAIVQGNWAAAIECLLSRFMDPKEKAFAARRLEEVVYLMRGMGMQKMGPLLEQKLFNSQRAWNVV